MHVTILWSSKKKGFVGSRVLNVIRENPFQILSVLIGSIGEKKNMDRVIWGQRVPEITGGLVGLLDVFVQRVPLVNCFSGASRGSVTILIVLFDEKILSEQRGLT